MSEENGYEPPVPAPNEYVDDDEINVIPEEERPTVDNDDYPEETRPDTQIGVYLGGTILLVVLMAFLMVIFSWIQRFVPWSVLVWFALAAILVALFWAFRTMSVIKQREPTQAQLDLPIDPEHVLVSRSSLRQALHYTIVDTHLTEGSDTGLFLVIHQDKKPVAVRCVNVVLAGLAFVLLCAAGHLPWQVGFLVFLVCLANCAWRMLEWHRWFLIATDKRITVVKSPPSFLWWMDDEPFPLHLRKVMSCHPAKQSLLGQMLGYGKLVITAIGDDEDRFFNNILYIKNAKKVSDRINVLKDHFSSEE